MHSPYWTKYPPWWYAGLAMFNWTGIQDSTYNGHAIAETLGEFLDGYLAVKLPNWQEVYGTVRNGEEILAGFGRMMSEVFNIPTFVFLTAGHSWAEYFALDIHLRLIAFGMAPPKEEAHFLANTSWAFTKVCREDAMPLLCLGMRCSAEDQQFQ